MHRENFRHGGRQHSSLRWIRHIVNVCEARGMYAYHTCSLRSYPRSGRWEGAVAAHPPYCRLKLQRAGRSGILQLLVITRGGKLSADNVQILDLEILVPC